MRNGFSRWICLLLCAAIFVGYLPITASAARNPMTVTIEDQYGNPVEGATVTATYKMVLFGSTTKLSDIAEVGNGVYTVDRDSANSQWYNITVNVSAPGYESATKTVSGSTTKMTITLTAQEGTEPTEPVETEPEPTETEPEPTETEPSVSEPEATEDPNADWQDFKMYYYINGSEENPFPSSYAGYSAVGNFGPSGDDTPFVTVSIDINKLKTQYSDVAIYQDGREASNNYNAWQFIPGTSKPNIADAEAFWAAVMDCMSEQSKKDFEATGISDHFVGYVLKNISYGGGGNLHCDGYLQVKPPVYSIELYMDEVTNNDQSNYVGGLLTNSGEEFHTMDTVLSSLEGYLGYTITWDEDENGKPIATNGVYNGAYIHGDHKHAITVQQTNTSKAQQIEGSEIPYEEKSSYYYVAYFVLTVDEEEPMTYTVTYTDGEANGASFYDHSYGLTQKGDTYPNVPAFPYEANWEKHVFLGWVLEGGDGTVYSNEEVQAMPVTKNMVFHAKWQAFFAVVFHTNNTNSQNEDVFRTYRSDVSEQQSGEYLLNQGKVDVFYDIPTFAYDVHNGYIFKGWYMGTETDAAPMDWDAVYSEETHIYAHWIRVGSVNKEDDGKIYESDVYPEYDLLGNQIRVATENPNQHYGDAAPGLRFIASLSERVYQEMNALHSNNHNGIEYGFVIAATSAAQSKANGNDYMLKYKHATLNGEDTTSTYSYVNNVPCRVPDVPVDDHYDGEQYRLYTAVITYKGLEGDRLTAAQNTNFIGRAYLRYFDANGLERVHYNNYTGNAQTYGGVNTCYSVVQQMIGEM